MSLTSRGQIGRGLQLWRLHVARAVALAPTSVRTALSALAVLVAHRLSAGRGRGSLLAARTLDERRPREAVRTDEAKVRPAA
jgi:hypothetical protein